MAELFDCCAAPTTSETFWQMFQSLLKEFSLPNTQYHQQSGISPEPSLVSVVIFFIGTAASFAYFCRFFSLFSILTHFSQHPRLPALLRKWSNKVNSFVGLVCSLFLFVCKTGFIGALKEVKQQENLSIRHHTPISLDRFLCVVTGNCSVIFFVSPELWNPTLCHLILMLIMEWHNRFDFTVSC